MKLKLNMFLKILVKTRKCLITAIFFLSKFSFTNIHEWEGKGGGEGHFFNSSLPLPPASQTSVCEAISNYSHTSKYYDNSNKLAFGIIKDERVGVDIKVFFGLKRNIYSFLVDDNSEDKKPNDANNGFVEKIGHSDYKDVLLNRKCLRRLLSRIQSRSYKIATYEIKKLSLSRFDDKIYIVNNGYDGLALRY